MRILFVTGYFYPANVYGGPTQSTAALCIGLHHAGAQVKVLTTDANGPGRLSVPLRQAVDVEGVPVFYYPLSLGGLGYFYSKSQAEAIRINVPESDLVVSQVLWGYAGEVVRSACSRYHIPYIIQPHGQLQPWALAHRACKKQIYMAVRGRKIIQQAAGLYFTDLEEAKSAQALGFTPPFFVVPNGVDLAHYQNLGTGGGVRQLLNIPDQAQVLLFLGRLDPVKRPDIAIRVCKALNQNLDRPVHLILAGPGSPSQVRALQQLAVQLGVTQQFHYMGLLSNGQVLEVLSAANLLIMPSAVRENFGMSALEALAASVPVLVSDGVPVGRWASEAGAGRAVACEVEAFSRSAKEMLSEPEMLSEMGRRGRELVRQKFDIQVVTHQVLDEFERIIYRYTGSITNSPCP